LCQGTLDDPKEDFPLWGMGKEVDVLYEACKELVNNPSRLSYPDFTIFKGFPFIDEFDKI